MDCFCGLWTRIYVLNMSSSIRVSDSNQLSVSLYTVFPFRIGHLQVVKKSINVWKFLRQTQDSVYGHAESQLGARVEEEGVPPRGSSAHLEFKTHLPLIEIISILSHILTILTITNISVEEG